MTELIFLQDLVVILTAAVAVVALLRRLHVPSIVEQCDHVHDGLRCQALLFVS